MKITAVFDKDGRILAGVIDDEKYDGPRPMPTEGTQAGTFDVPASDNALGLEEICKSFRVDAKSKSLKRHSMDRSE